MSREGRQAGVKLVLMITADSDDEMRALYQAILRARGEERTEEKRLRTLRATGYGNDSFDSQRWRAEARERMLDRLLWEVDTEMKADGIEPW